MSYKVTIFYNLLHRELISSKLDDIYKIKVTYPGDKKWQHIPVKYVE